MRIRSRHQFAALFATTAIVLAACGGTSSGTTPPTLPSLADAVDNPDSAATTTTTEAVDPEEALLEYAACMRENGVDMPDPSNGAVVFEFSAGDLEAFEEAETKCSPILENVFGEFQLTPEQEAEARDQQLAFAKCMRDEGIDWPDPGPNGSVVVGIGPDEDVDPDMFNAAMESCSEETYGTSGGFSIIERDETTP